MCKFLLCDDNGEAYDVNLLLYEGDGGGFMILVIILRGTN